MNSAREMFFGKVAIAAKELLHQAIVAFGDYLDKFFMQCVGFVSNISRNIILGVVTGSIGLETHHLHLHDVDDLVEARSRLIRKLYNSYFMSEMIFHFFDDIIPTCLRCIEFIDDEDNGVL